MRLIDAEELERLFNAQIEQGVGVICAFDAFYDALQDTPTVDAVPVVRCKECKHCRELNRKGWVEEAYADGVLWCMNQSDGVWPDDFCSYGEQRGGGEDG